MAVLPEAPGETDVDVDDADLVEQSLSEPERFALVYDRYFDDIHRYLAGRLGRQIADDLAAEAFLIAFQRRRTFDPHRGAIRPWLYGIATNLVSQHRRTENRRLSAVGKLTAQTSVDGHEDRVAARVTAEKTRPGLVNALRALSLGDRDVVFLVALGGLSYEEIALALDIPAGTVGSRLNRARKKLRHALGGADPMEEA
jgi:RNA polymerase sigma factor (sigma-70 family)